MKLPNHFIICLLLLLCLSVKSFFSQSNCNIQASICEPGVTSSFPFLTNADGPPFDYVNPSGCGTGESGNDFGFGFVMLHITASGPLNLQIVGDVPIGHLDFVVYDIPLGMDPCVAVLDSNNQIACNFSTQSIGCTQFGNSCTGCPSIVAAPFVNAGQQVMIITHDYDNVLTSFTLELCPGGAETGDFDATIVPPPALTDTSASVTLQAATGGGTWSASCGGCINANTGVFNPQTAGVGTHEVSYQVGNVPCAGYDTVEVFVQSYCTINLEQGNEICENTQNTFLSAQVLGNYPVQYVWTNFPAGDTLQIITADSTSSMFNSADTLFNLSTGTYILNIQTAEGCQNSSFINVALTPVLDSSFSYSASLFCQNGASITPDFIATPQSTNFYANEPNIAIDSITGVIDVTNTQSGIYTIFNTPNTCSGTHSFEITIDSAEDPSFYLMDTICAFINPAEVIPFDSIVSPGGFFWSADEDLNITDTVNGIVQWTSAQKDTITTIYYNTGGFCSEIDSAQVYVKQLNSYFSYEYYQMCVFEVTNIFPDSIHTQTGSLLTSYFYCDDPNLVIDSTSGEIDVSASLLGDYDVYRVVDDQCLDTTMRTVTITDFFDAYFTYPVTEICQFELPLAPDTVSSGNGEFSATPFGLAIDPDNGTIDLDLSNAGIYTIQHITPQDCADTSFFVLEVLDVPSPLFTYADTLLCDANGTVLPNFVQNPGGTFSGTAGLIIDPNTGEIDLDNSHHGSHFVTYTTVGTCTAFHTVNVIISDTRNSYFTYEFPSYCGNLPSQLPDSIATTGGTFTAVPSGLVINSLTGLINLGASTPNIYDIRYVSSGFCKDTSYFSLEVLDVPSSDFGYASFAFCDAAATGIISPDFINTPGGTFSSNAGIVLDAVTGEIDLDASTNGVYPISYTTTGVCPSTSNYNFTIGNTPTVSFSYASNTFCKNEPNPTPNFVSVTGGTFTSSSSGLFVGSTSGTIFLAFSAPGTYTITYTSPGACSSSATFNVTINAAPITTFSYPQNYYCNYNDPVSPSTMPSISGGTFSSASGLNIDNTTGEINFSTSTPGTYIINYTTPGICPTVSSYTMNVHPSICDCDASLPVFEAYVNGVLGDINALHICYGDTLQIIPQLGSAWNPQPYFPGSSTVYSPQMQIDIFECPPSVFAPDDFYSANPCFTGATLPQTGHSWEIVNDTANFQPYVNTFDDTTLYLVPHTMYNNNTLSVFNPLLGNRCYAVDTIKVNFLPMIRSQYVENCLDSTVAITVTGGMPAYDGSTFQFNNFLPNTASISPSTIQENEIGILYPLENGDDYSFTIIDNAGCELEFSNTNFTGTPIADAGQDTTICFFNGNLNAEPFNFGYGYWSSLQDVNFADSAINTTAFSVNEPGVYKLIWTAGSNPQCENKDTITVVISEIELEIDIIDTYCFAREGAIEMNASNGIAPYTYSIYNGNNSQTSPFFETLSEGDYVIWVSDSSGCIVIDNITVGLTDPCEIIFYTGFTPNNDNINDTWFIEGLPSGQHKVSIMNRWGDVIWKTEAYDNFDNAWDGTSESGEMMPEGVYYYVVEVFDRSFKGFIELSR